MRLLARPGFVRSSKAVHIAIALILCASCRSSSTAPSTEKLNAPKTDPSIAPLATVANEPIALSDLSPGTRRQIAELDLDRYGALANEVSALVERRLIERAAKEAGLESGAFLKREVERRALAVTPEDVEKALATPPYAPVLERMLASFEESGAAGTPASGVKKASTGSTEDRVRVREKRRAEAREQVAKRASQMLTQERENVARGQLIEEWREKYGVTVAVGVPDVPRVEVSSEGFVVVGPGAVPNGPTIHLYLDPTDPAARRVVRELNAQLTFANPAPRVLVTYVPGGSRAEAPVYAEALQCALASGKGAEFHEALFRDAQVPGTEKLVELGSGVGLDSKGLAACITGHEKREAAQAVVHAGRPLGAANPPVLFVNGIRLAPRQTSLVRALLRDDLSQQGEKREG